MKNNSLEKFVITAMFLVTFDQAINWLPMKKTFQYIYIDLVTFYVLVEIRTEKYIIYL